MGSLAFLVVVDDDVVWFERNNLEAERPRVRADCEFGPRPCIWVSCRHHMAIEVGDSENTESLTMPARGWGAGGKRTISNKTPAHMVRQWIEDAAEMVVNMRETCSLDVSAGEIRTLEDVGGLFSFTRERARQVEGLALEDMRRQPRRLGQIDD